MRHPMRFSETQAPHLWGRGDDSPDPQRGCWADWHLEWTLSTKGSTDICNLCRGTFDADPPIGVWVSTTRALLQSSSPSRTQSWESSEQSQFKTQDATWKVVWLVWLTELEKWRERWSGWEQHGGFYSKCGVALPKGAHVCKWVRELVKEWKVE